MNKSNMIFSILVASSVAFPAVAQQAANDPDTTDVVSDGYRRALQEDGLISRQININDQILLLEREKDRAEAITSLVDALGYDARVTLPDGEILDLSTTKAGREAQLAEIQREQSLIDARVALERKRAREKLLDDPGILEAMRLAEEADLTNELVDRIGPDLVIEMADGRMVDLGETNAGKLAEIESLKTETNLAKARADLESQQNAILRIEAEREQIARERELEQIRLERERNRARQASERPEQASPNGQSQQPQRIAAPAVSIQEIFGSNRDLQASLAIGDSSVVVRVGDPIGSFGEVLEIDRTFVVIGNDSGKQKFFIY